MKTCRICGNPKSLDDFGKRSRSKDGHESFCKDCGSGLYASYYQQARDKNLHRIRSNQERYRENIKQFIASVKCGKSCLVCEESEPVCLDFHHIEKKEATIANMVNRSVGIDKLKIEMMKCVLLCANCHRKLHAGLFELIPGVARKSVIQFGDRS